MLCDLCLLFSCTLHCVSLLAYDVCCLVVCGVGVLCFAGFSVAPHELHCKSLCIVRSYVFQWVLTSLSLFVVHRPFLCSVVYVRVLLVLLLCVPCGDDGGAPPEGDNISHEEVFPQDGIDNCDIARARKPKLWWQ